MMGGEGGYGGGHSRGYGDENDPSVRGWDQNPMMGGEGGYGGGHSRGYGDENDPSVRGWDQNPSMGWNPNMTSSGMMSQGYSTTYPGLGQQQQNHPQQQFQHQDFGQNYGQSMGGGAMKRHMGGGGYGGPTGRQAPYSTNNYGR